MTFEGLCLHVITEYEGRIVKGVVNFFIKEEEQGGKDYTIPHRKHGMGKGC